MSIIQRLTSILLTLFFVSALPLCAAALPLAPVAPPNPGCFNYESFQHGAVVPLAVVPPTNSALVNYGYANILANHVGMGAPIAVRVSLGNFMPGALIVPWATINPFPAAVPPLNVGEFSLIINQKRRAHRIPVRGALPGLLLGAIALGGAAAMPVPGAMLYRSLRDGGYLHPMVGVLHRMETGAVPILVPPPGVIPDSVVVHIATPVRASRNLRELSHSSLSTAIPGGLTLKDRINAPYAAVGLPLPHSATIISCNQLQ